MQVLSRLQRPYPLLEYQINGSAVTDARVWEEVMVQVLVLENEVLEVPDKFDSSASAFLL